MSLDLTRVVVQVEGMVARLKGGGDTREQHLRNALDVLADKANDLERLSKKIEAAKTTWSAPAFSSKNFKNFSAVSSLA